MCRNWENWKKYIDMGETAAYWYGVYKRTRGDKVLREQNRQKALASLKECSDFGKSVGIIISGCSDLYFACEKKYVGNKLNGSLCIRTLDDVSGEEIDSGICCGHYNY